MGTLFEHGIDAGSNNARIPIVDSDGNLSGLNKIISIDYGGAHADYTLPVTQAYKGVIVCTNNNGDSNLILPSENRTYTIFNNTTSTLTVKASGQTGVRIQAGGKENVWFDGTDYQKTDTFTRPTLNGFKLRKLGSISLGSGDVTLSGSQVDAGILEVTTGHATNALQFNTSAYPVTYAAYIVVNKDAVNQVNFKRVGGTACVIPAGKGAFVYYDGTDFKALPFT